jgi:hypothetical protein
MNAGVGKTIPPFVEEADQNLFLIFLHAIVEQTMADRTERDDVGVHVQTVGEFVLYVQRDEMVPFHIRLTVCQRGEGFVVWVRLAKEVFRCKYLPDDDPVSVRDVG